MPSIKIRKKISQTSFQNSFGLSILWLYNWLYSFHPFRCPLSFVGTSMILSVSWNFLTDLIEFGKSWNDDVLGILKYEISNMIRKLIFLKFIHPKLNSLVYSLSFCTIVFEVSIVVDRGGVYSSFFSQLFAYYQWLSSFTFFFFAVSFFLSWSHARMNHDFSRLLWVSWMFSLMKHSTFGFLLNLWMVDNIGDSATLSLSTLNFGMR